MKIIYGSILVNKKKKKNHIKKYIKYTNNDFEDYCINLTDNEWIGFKNKLNEFLSAFKSNDAPFRVEEIDLKKEFESVDENSIFISKIDGMTLKGVSVSSHAGELPAKGVLNVKYEKGKGKSCALYTVSPAKINFFQTPTGGLVITVCPPQSEGLMKNTPEVIIFKFFRRIKQVTNYDIYLALKFFLLCSREKTLWGKTSFWGSLKYNWITKYRHKKWDKLLSAIDKAISLFNPLSII